MICSQEPRDVFLVVDGSLSIGEAHFEKIRQFLTKLVKTVVVNPNMTHFGLLQFSSRQKTRIEFSLDYSHREATLLNRIKYLRYQQGTSTYTGNALKIVEQQVSLMNIHGQTFLVAKLVFNRVEAVLKNERQRQQQRCQEILVEIFGGNFFQFLQEIFIIFVKICAAKIEISHHCEQNRTFSVSKLRVNDYRTFSLKKISFSFPRYSQSKAMIAQKWRIS